MEIGKKVFSGFNGPPIYSGIHTTTAATAVLLASANITDDTGGPIPLARLLLKDPTVGDFIAHAITFTNQDATDSIYLDFTGSASASASKFVKKLGPGEYFEVDGDPIALLKGCSTFPSANTPAVRIAIWP